MDKFDFYFKVLARYDQYIQLANTKASNHITLLASMLVAVTALVGWGGDFTKINFCTSLIVFFYIIFLYLSYEWYSRCMAVIHPNRSRNTANTVHQNEDELSLIFYSDVSKFSTFNNFKSKAINNTKDEHLDDLLHQVFIMAKVTEKKFDDYEKVNGFVTKTVLISLLILFVCLVNKLGAV